MGAKKGSMKRDLLKCTCQEYTQILWELGNRSHVEICDMSGRKLREHGHHGQLSGYSRHKALSQGARGN